MKRRWLRDQGMTTPQAIDSTAVRTVTLALDDVTCPSCVDRIREALGAVRGVTAVSVDFQHRKAAVSYEASMLTESALVKAVHSVGYAARVIPDEGRRQDPRPGAPTGCGCASSQSSCCRR